MKQVIQLSKDDEFKKALEEVSTKIQSGKELEQNLSGRQEKRELACIMLGLMVEADLPLKFYEALEKSPRIRMMLKKLMSDADNKRHVFHLINDEGQVGKNETEKASAKNKSPETVVLL